MIDTLLSIVREAGELSFNYFGKLTEAQVEHKTEEVDLVTPVDREVEDLLRMRLHEAFPHVAFIGEEGDYATDAADNGTAFVADPIDGTTNYVHSIPYYSVSVALRENSRLQAGAVYLPYFDIMYHAQRGKGAFRNDQPIRVSRTDSLIKSVACTGFACVRERVKPNNIDLFIRALDRVRAMRNTGSAAIDCCYVADGRFDLYWELNLKPWDVAAGTLIIKEAGGTVTNLSGEEEFNETESFLASNARVHEEFLKLSRAI